MAEDDGTVIVLNEAEERIARFAIRQAILHEDRKIDRAVAKFGDAYDPARDACVKRLLVLEDIYRKLGLDPDAIEINEGANRPNASNSTRTSTAD